MNHACTIRALRTCAWSILQEIFGGYGLDLGREDLFAGGVNYGDMAFTDDTLVMQVRHSRPGCRG